MTVINKQLTESEVSIQGEDNDFYHISTLKVEKKSLPKIENAPKQILRIKDDKLSSMSSPVIEKKLNELQNNTQNSITVKTSQKDTQDNIPQGYVDLFDELNQLQNKENEATKLNNKALDESKEMNKSELNHINNEEIDFFNDCYVVNNKTSESNEINSKPNQNNLETTTIKNNYIQWNNSSKISHNQLNLQQKINFDIVVGFKMLGNANVIAVSFNNQESATIFKKILLCWGITQISTLNEQSKPILVDKLTKDQSIYLSNDQTLELVKRTSTKKLYDEKKFLNVCEQIKRSINDLVDCGPAVSFVFAYSLDSMKTPSFVFINFGESISPYFEPLLNILTELKILKVLVYENSTKDSNMMLAKEKPIKMIKELLVNSNSFHLLGNDSESLIDFFKSQTKDIRNKDNVTNKKSEQIKESYIFKFLQQQLA